MLVVPMLAASLAHRFSAGLLSGIGLMVAAIGLFWLSRVEVGAGAWALALPLLVIGIGTGIPWGLMDGLSVSVVPKERAGMATGIFSTTRVAGEGIALAIVSAILAAFAHSGLATALPGQDAATPRSLTEAAQNVATGNIDHALSLVADLSRSSLIGIYTTAFESLLYILIAITVVSALVVFVFLGDTATEPADELPATSPGE
jgi:hypothetical protein